jgi:hypothetical protein
MTTAQVSLTDEQTEALRDLAQRTGKTEDQLLHEAIECFLSQRNRQDRLSLLRKARGIWKDRQDLPSVRELRAEFDRFQPPPNSNG